MKAIIDQLEKEMKADARLYGVKVDAYGDAYALPEDLPYVNVIPRGKPRKRQFVIGAPILYNVDVEIEAHCWQASVDNMRDAFDKCETLAETVLEVLADISASNLGVDAVESQIEKYDGGQYEGAYYYSAVILIRAKKDETHS